MATTAWTSGSLDAAYADRLLGPADVAMMDAGSMPIPDGMTAAEWLEREGVAPSGSREATGPVHVSRRRSMASPRSSPRAATWSWSKDRRGYVFRFHASLATNIDLRETVRSIELHPEDAGT